MESGASERTSRSAKTREQERGSREQGGAGAGSAVTPSHCNEASVSVSVSAAEAQARAEAEAEEAAKKSRGPKREHDARREARSKTTNDLSNLARQPNEISPASNEHPRLKSAHQDSDRGSITSTNNWHQEANSDKQREENKKNQPAADETTKEEQFERNMRKWKRRLRMTFCCVGFRKNKDSLSDVSQILSQLTSSPALKPATIAASLLLVKKYQLAQQDWLLEHSHESGVLQILSSVPVTKSSRFLDLSKPDESHLLAELIYFLNYSLAIFGWPLYALDGLYKVCCLLPYLTLGCCPRVRSRRVRQAAAKQQPERADSRRPGAESAGGAQRHERPLVASECEIPVVIGDNCVGCNLATADQRLSEHHYEIIYVNYASAINVVPFMVVADHAKRTIVVGVRGSMALTDAVIDMNAQIERIPIEPARDDFYGHRGMILSASRIHQMIGRMRILEAAFACRPELASDKYKLLFCGHSLGAGIASILGILFRAQYPALRCFLYSPPGGILSRQAVEYTKEFATGAFLGQDCVPRLGFSQLMLLRYQGLWARTQAPSQAHSSSRILARALVPRLCCCFASKEQIRYEPGRTLDFMLGKAADCPPFEYKGDLISYPNERDTLYVPGRLLHVLKNYEHVGERRRRPRNPRDKEPLFQAIWVENTDYDRIVIGDGMFTDHLPFDLAHSLKMLFSRSLPAPTAGQPGARAPSEDPSADKLLIEAEEREATSHEPRPPRAPDQLHTDPNNNEHQDSHADYYARSGSQTFDNNNDHSFTNLNLSPDETAG